MSNAKREDVLGIEISLDEIKEGMTLDDYFYIDDLKSRKIFINDEINPYSVSDAVSNIIRFNKVPVNFENTCTLIRVSTAYIVSNDSTFILWV